MTPGAQAVYDELSGRKGVLDGIDDEEIITELCEATAAAVLATVPGHGEGAGCALTPPAPSG